MSTFTPSAHLTPSPHRSRRGGFALLITITLLAFLVLLLVSLASLTRVETQVASNNQSLAQARQNALFALNVALGQLQKYTGPDQRVTATADIAASASGGRLAGNTVAQNTSAVNGTLNGLAPASATASVQNGTRWWTGVWGRAGTTYAVVAKSVYDETPSPVLLNWLVSGNEDRAFTTDTSGLVKTSTSDGRTTANTALFTPGATINWAAAGLDPSAPASWSGGYSNIEIKAAGQKAVLLVGPKTAGANPDATGGAAVDRYVVAPLKDISVPSANVPGAGSSGNVTIGRYAWWVGDEGVKASYALVDPRPGKTTPGGSTTDASESRLRLMSASRTGAELIPGFGAYPAADDTAAAVRLNRLLQMPQASLLDPSLSPDAQKSRFHDFTGKASGVLSDALNGGLRQDLTYYFELPKATWDASSFAGKGIIPAGWSPNWGTSASPDYAPKWDWLYSFYNTNPTNVASPTLAVRPETPTAVGITPIITQFRMIAFTDSTKLGPLNTVGNIPPGQVYQLPIRSNVAFVLANPYNVTLTAPANTYEFVLQNTYTSSNPAVPTNPPVTAPVNETPGGLVIGVSDPNHNYSESLGSLVLLRAPNDTVTKSMLDTVRFTLPAFSIPPGGTCVFSIKGKTQVAGGTAPVAAGSEAPVELEVNDSGNPIVAKTRYFTSGNTLDFTAPAAPKKTIALLYVHDQVFITITLRATGSNLVLQQLKDCGFSKTQETAGVENEIIGNLHIKFIPPARRNMDSSSAAEVFNYNLRAYARPYQDLNLRAATSDHLAVDTPGKIWNAPSYAGGICRLSYQSPAAAFTENLTPATWAENFGPETRSPVASQGIFFDFPRKTAEQPPVISLGQLQHASLTADDWHPGTSINYQSANAVGNSYSSPFVTRGQAVQNRAKGWYKAPTNNIRYFDMAYLLNTALWDGFFFSGIPQTDPVAFAPLNSRYSIYDGAGATDVRKSTSSSHLLVNGAFNVNSTSHDAWVALLGGLNGLRVNNDTTADGVPFPRTLWQPVTNTQTGSSYKSSGTGNDSYAGYRRLSAAEIDSLATEIVKRVRARGPFVSLSHFINRSLVAASSAFNSSINDADTSGNLAATAVPMGRGLTGPLQAAIDSTAAGINTFQQIGSDIVTANGAGAYGDRVLFAGEMLSTTSARPFVSGDAGYNAQPVYFADKLVDLPNLDPIYGNAAPPGPQGRTSTGIPGWLLQGDILQSVGPALSARSDTFVIRTYGEVLNPTDSTQTQARAWCEAVVQRLPTYVQPASDAPEVLPAALTSADNKAFGRAYKVISFRWLSSEDI
ncbi:MAG: hypothetical protein ACAH89_12260 [Rariglobus sp.]